MYQRPLVTLASMNDFGLFFHVRNLASSLRWPVHSASGIPSLELFRELRFAFADEHKEQPSRPVHMLFSLIDTKV